MKAAIDDFQRKLSEYFRELTLAHAYLEIGHAQIAQAPAQASITLLLSEGVTSEPYFLHELLGHRAAVGRGVLELFQTKAIAAWHDLLSAVFEQILTAHLAGTKTYPQLKRAGARLDFALEIPIPDQVRQSLIADYSFKPYAERIAPLAAIMHPDGQLAAERMIVRKHVLIRNAIQHHRSRVYPHMLTELGRASLEVLNPAGQPITLEPGQLIDLSVPELDLLKGTLFVLTSNWKTIDA